MASPTNSADVAVGIQGAWTTLGLSNTVPGGLWWGRVGENAGNPYATLLVEEGDPLYTALRDFIQPFRLQITVWSSAGGKTAGDIQQALDAVLNNDQIGLITLRNGRVMSLMRAAGEVKDDPARRAATDVKMGAARWELMVQTAR